MGCAVLVVLAAGAGRRFGGTKQLTAVGPAGEALMDYTIHRARRAGFTRIVVVARPEADAVMREHFSQVGPLPVEVVHQPPGLRGTVPAVLAARLAARLAAEETLAADEAFAVVNADDLYPADALEALHAWAGPGCAVVGFRLAHTIQPGSSTVNRAVCHVDAANHLRSLVETPVVERNGRYWAGAPGNTPDRPVAGEQLVSMNAWAFPPSIWDDLDAAIEDDGGGGGEILLPVVMARLVAQGSATVTVLPVEGACIGITWPDDLVAVRAQVAEMVATGQLPARVGECR